MAYVDHQQARSDMAAAGLSDGVSLLFVYSTISSATFFWRYTLYSAPQSLSQIAFDGFPGRIPHTAFLERIKLARPREQIEVFGTVGGAFTRFRKRQEFPFLGFREGTQVQIDGTFNGLGDEEGQRRFVSLIRRLEDAVVLLPVVLENDREREAFAHEKDVHRKTRRPSVPIEERVNEDEFVMKERREFYWMQRFLVLLEPAHEPFHPAWHIDSVGRRMIGSADDHGAGAVPSGKLGVSLAHHELMELANEVFGDGIGILRDEIVEEIKRLLVVLRFQVILERLALDRHAFLQNEPSLPERQTVPFDGVTVVRHFHFKLLAQLFYLRRVERSERIEFRKFFIKPFPETGIEEHHILIMA